MIPYNAMYERWVPFFARLFLAIQFGTAAWFKISMFGAQAVETAAVGVPEPNIAVGLALILEVLGVISLLSGWRVRFFSMLLAAYAALLAVLFYHDWSNQLNFGFFMSHLGLVAALLYVSVYGAKSISVGQD